MIATTTYTVGTYPHRTADLLSTPWVLDPNAPSGIAVEDLFPGETYGTTEGLLNLGIPKRLADRHVGGLCNANWMALSLKKHMGG